MSGPCGRSTGRRGGPGPVRGVALEASRMLNNAWVSEHEGQFELQIASETAMWQSWPHVVAVLAALGRKCARRPLRLPCSALEHMFLPRPNMLLSASVFEPEGQFDL